MAQLTPKMAESGWHVNAYGRTARASTIKRSLTMLYVDARTMRPYAWVGPFDAAIRMDQANR